MKGSNFLFNYLDLLHWKCHKIDTNRGASYIDSPDWKKATLNSENNGNKCIHEENGQNSERISKTKRYVDKYNWKRKLSTRKQPTEKIWVK